MAAATGGDSGDRTGKPGRAHDHIRDRIGDSDRRWGHSPFRREDSRSGGETGTSLLGNDADLVLRSPVSNFTIPREGAIEQYFIRQYDGSTPPNYSRFSSAVFINVPL